jgi:hypothetical protein
MAIRQEVISGHTLEEYPDSERSLQGHTLAENPDAGFDRALIK